MILLFFSYLWTILISGVELFIIFSLFSVPNNRFEEVVISALVIIYLTIKSVGGGLSFIYFKMSKKSDTQFLSLYEGVTPQKYEQEKESFEVVMEDNEKKLVHTKAKMYISLCFMTVAYFIALYHLIVTGY